MFIHIHLFNNLVHFLYQVAFKRLLLLEVIANPAFSGMTQSLAQTRLPNGGQAWHAMLRLYCPDL